MIIYIKKNYTWDGEKYVEHNHRNYQRLSDAKNNVREYIVDFREQLDEDFKIIKEEEYDKQELLYEIEFSWKGYFNIVRKEKITITQEYVF